MFKNNKILSLIIARSGSKGLKNKNLIDAIKHKVSEGTPLLGICLGMQLLFTESEENGVFEGLNLIPGKVVKLKYFKENIKIPHIGWNKIIPQNKNWKNTIMEKTNVEKDYFYFVHSYHAQCKNYEDVLMTTNYGYEFVSAIERDNISGFQFHPEKSQRNGLKLLRNFLDYAYKS